MEEIKEKKGIGKVLSEALDVISANPVIIIPYIIPVIVAVIGAFAAVGAIFTEVFRTGFEVDPQFFIDNILRIVGVALGFFILVLIFAVVADAFAIIITYNAMQGKKATLSEAWNQIGVEKVLILLAVMIITWILIFLGLFAICIGAFVVATLLAFVGQGVIIDNAGFGTFGNSFNIAKDNFFDVLILVVIFLVLWFVVGLVPWIGWILRVLVGMYAVVAYTVLYLDRK